MFPQKKAYQRGVTGTPGPRYTRYAPGEWTEAASGMVFVPALTLSGYGVNIVCYTAVFSVVTQRSVGRSVA